MKLAHLLFAVFATALTAPAIAQTAAFDSAIVQNGQRETLLSIAPQVRTAARALGFGGVGQYAVLPGLRATLRVTTPQPTFIVAAPGNVQPQGLFTVARFEPRRNGTREILIGGGYMSYSSGIAADRLVAMNVSRAASQRGAPAGSILYELTPAAPLTAGEYALIVAGGQQAVPMAGLAGTFYDFGMD